MVRPIHSMIAVALLLLTSSPAQAERVQFPICGSGKRITCMVDGDTLWYQGVKYRLEGIDAPEKAPRHKCMQEGLQARMATERLAEMMSKNDFTITTHGKDRNGRTLARFHIGDTTAGQMLVNEGLAKVWKGRKAEWCH